MAKSKRLLQLEKRLNVLREHFIPPLFSPLGSYDKRTQDQARAFILLAHAELESYVEDRAREKVDQAHRGWKSNRVCNVLMSRLLLYHSAKSAKAEGWGLNLPSDKSVGKAVNFYVSELSQNHGIREQNILSILIPIGLSHSKIDTTLLATLDSFGAVRGTLAHLSVKAHQSIDPKTISANVWSNIVPNLEQLDKNINQLR